MISEKHILKALDIYYQREDIPLVEKLEFARVLGDKTEVRAKDLTRLVAYDLAQNHIVPVLSRMIWDKTILKDGKMTLIGTIKSDDERSRISFNLVMRSYQMLTMGEEYKQNESIVIRFTPTVKAIYMPQRETLTFLCDDEEEYETIKARYNITCRDPNNLDFTSLDFTEKK